MSLAEVIDSFYELLPDANFRKVPVVGQVCWVPAPRLETVPFILDVERSSPTEHYATKFDLRQMTNSDFRSKNRLPLKLLNLRDTEELVVARTKRRLAIIVAADHTIFEDLEKLLRQRAQRHLQERSVIVAPLYGVSGPDHAGGFPPVMVARVKALLYRQFFYCPENSSPWVYESVARLDRLEPMMPIAPGYEPTQVALSKEALAVLMAMLRTLFGAPDEPDLAALRELLKEALPAVAMPSR